MALIKKLFKISLWVIGIFVLLLIVAGIFAPVEENINESATENESNLIKEETHKLDVIENEITETIKNIEKEKLVKPSTILPEYKYFRTSRIGKARSQIRAVCTDPQKARHF